MNVHVTALQEQHSRHKAIRAKLWFAEPPKPAPAEVVAPIVKIIYARRPTWKLHEINFDLHVQQYRKRLLSIASGPTIVYIQDRCRELGVSYADIIVPCRRREFVRPRQLIMSELRYKFNLSYPKIGKLFGNLDHTTVIASLRRVEIMKARGEL